MPFGTSRAQGFNNTKVALLQAGNTIINKYGEFVYQSGAPAAGNLVSSQAGFGGTDQFGNAYLGGNTSYAPIPVLALQTIGNAIILYSAPTQAGPYISAGLPEILFTASPPSITLYGALKSTGGTPANPTLITTDVWNTPALNAHYGNQAGAAELSYMLGINNRVYLDGVVTLAAGFANPIFTIPAGYRPPGLAGFPVGVIGAAVATGAPYLTVTTGGAVQTTGVPAAATALYISGSWPLDIPTA